MSHFSTSLLRCLIFSVLFCCSLDASDCTGNQDQGTDRSLSNQPSESPELPQSSQGLAAPAKPRDDKVVATVDGHAISRQLVLNALPPIFAQFSKPQQEALEQAMLGKLIEQQLAFAYLKSRRLAVGEGEVKLQLDALKAELAKLERSLDQYLAKRRLTLDELKHEIAMRETWQRYARKKLTDKYLEAHYQSHPRKFDGTEVRVAHILLKVGPDQSASTRLEEAESIVKLLEKGALTWQAAVNQFSDGTKAAGGEIGKVLLTPSMPSRFVEAARELETGQIGKPVQTQFGVHVIKCLEVYPGKRGWRDARDEVAKDASSFLYQTIVQRQRRKSQVIIVNAN